ncbi:hypothetical protein PC128_g23829 [Phytophthora cactorum]|nr:hypothetical protein PC128_g23829 [Phytophthora cactorum]
MASFFCLASGYLTSPPFWFGLPGTALPLCVVANLGAVESDPQVLVLALLRTGAEAPALTCHNPAACPKYCGAATGLRGGVVCDVLGEPSSESKCMRAPLTEAKREETVVHRWSPQMVNVARTPIVTLEPSLHLLLR